MSGSVRALLIAEKANPEWVSVPLVGWSLATAIRDLDGVDAHIVTQIRNRDAFVRAGLVEGRDFTAIDSERVARPAHRVAEVLRMGKGKGWTTVSAMNAVAYPYFEHLLWRMFGDRIRAGEFDLVHRITPLSPTIASPIAPRLRNAGVPFVLGPINGGLPWPKGFDSERRREKEWLSYVRGAYKLLPGRGRTLAAATAVICGSRHTLGEMGEAHSGKLFYIPENAIDTSRFNLAPRSGVSSPLKCCFVGRLVPYKGADMLIEALAPLLSEGRVTLDVVGDGPMRAELVELAGRLGVSGGVTFHGNVEHIAVQRVLGDCDLFTFPSVREFGGAVVIEAMYLGAVPIVVDYGGPGEHVTPGTGFALSMGGRDDIIAALRHKVREIAGDPSALPAMREAAILRAKTLYTWPRKAEQVLEVYEWALGRRKERPEPFR